MELATAWLGFLASPSAPREALSLLELEGYLTGIAVAPRLIMPSRWLDGLWNDPDGTFDSTEQANAVLGAVMERYNAINLGIDASLAKLEQERVCDYRPAYREVDEGPGRAALREWVAGFWKAMSLDPGTWSDLAADERLQPVIGPFVGFIDLGEEHAFEPADDIEERLEQSAAEIPRAILLLRKIAKLKAKGNSAPRVPARQPKIGRNDPCPCGSGLKYKRCCGRD
jgi:uncharacterized protein